MQPLDSDIPRHVTALRFHLCRMWITCSLAAAIGCSGSARLAPANGYSSKLGAEHPLVGRIYRGATRAPIAASALVAALNETRYLVLGETHDNRDHHQLQAQLLQQFLAAQSDAAVGFEMLDEDDSPLLTQAPTPSSSAELAQRVDWAKSGWPDFTHYQPIFDVAFDAHARVIAAHPNATHVRASLQGLDEVEARELRIDTPLPEAQVQAQHQEIRDSHCGHASPPMLTAMQRAQVYKDAFMARALARTQRPTALIAGRGHARNDRAVPYFLQRARAGRSLSIAFIEVDDRRTDPNSYDTTAFDYVIFTPRTSDEDPCEKFRVQLEQMRSQHGSGSGER